MDELVETPDPVMFVRNTYDPSTAVAGAYKMSKLFAGNFVVEQKGLRGRGPILAEQKKLGRRPVNVD